MNNVTAEINGYIVSVHYAGDRASPLDPANFDCNVVKVMNKKTRNHSMLTCWRPKVTDASSALYTFYCLLQSAMFGALDPQQFCEAMEITDPETNEDARVIFHNHRTNAARLAPILNSRDELLETMKMIEQKLGLKKEKA